MNDFDLTSEKLSALREISSVSAGKMAKSLTALLKRRVNVAVPEVTLEVISNVSEVLGGRDTVAHVLYFAVSGQIEGSILFVLSSQDTLSFVGNFMGKNITRVEKLRELELSALKELGNICVGSYLRTLDESHDLRHTHSVPGYTCDMLGAALDGILVNLSFDSEYVVLIEHEFSIGEKANRAHFVFIFEPESLKRLLKTVEI